MKKEGGASRLISAIKFHPLCMSVNGLERTANIELVLRKSVWKSIHTYTDSEMNGDKLRVLILTSNVTVTGCFINPGSAETSAKHG